MTSIGESETEKDSGLGRGVQPATGKSEGGGESDGLSLFDAFCAGFDVSSAEWNGDSCKRVGGWLHPDEASDLRPHFDRLATNNTPTPESVSGGESDGLRGAAAELADAIYVLVLLVENGETDTERRRLAISRCNLARGDVYENLAAATPRPTKVPPIADGPLEELPVLDMDEFHAAKSNLPEPHTVLTYDLAAASSAPTGGGDLSTRDLAVLAELPASDDDPIPFDARRITNRIGALVEHVDGLVVKYRRTPEGDQALAVQTPEGSAE